MTDSGDSALPGACSRIRNPHTWISVAALALALAGGAAATVVPTAYVLGFLLLGFVAAFFLWRSQDPMVPFLVLVAAIQGGILLRLPLGDAPIETLMPFLGGWTVVAVLINPNSNRLRTTYTAQDGKLLPFSLVALCAVVALTALAQNWREGGRLIELSAAFTLVQLGVLVVVAGHLLTTPRKVVMVAYVTVAAGAVAALVALVNQAGLVVLGTESRNTGSYVRASGLLDDPNFFSFELLISLAFAIHIASAARSTPVRVVTWVAAAVIAAGIVSSYSAGALVGVAAVAVTVLVLHLRVSAKKAMAALAIMVVATVVVAATAPSGYGEAIKGKYTQIAASPFEEMGTNRGAAWEASLREILDNPVLGTGLSADNEVVAIAEHYTLRSEPEMAAHQMYLGIAVGTGVFGLAAFVVVLGSCFSLLWMAHSKAVEAQDSEATLAVACLFTGLVVVATQGLQLDTQFMKYTWLLIGVCLGIRRWSLLGKGKAA